jgi:2-polyprenyl-3-methyl-5-hydroxy-6-metoxy-1,4-benzoquinol methylase
MTSEREQIKVWERVEVERSAAEASHKDVSALRYTEENLARYMEPPAETAYPLEYAYHLLGDVRGKTVLDLGCGDGENTVLLVRRGARVLGMDISADLISVARRRMEANGISSGYDFMVTSAHDMALGDESVDVVFGMAILHHLDLRLAAREVRRVLRKGGRAIFQEPVRNSKTVAALRGLVPYRSPDVSPFERPLTDAELREFAEGYSGYRSRAFLLPYVSLLQLLSKGRLMHAAYRFDGALLRRLPPLGHYATVRVVEMTK